MPIPIDLDAASVRFTPDIVSLHLNRHTSSTNRSTRRFKSCSRHFDHSRSHSLAGLMITKDIALGQAPRALFPVDIQRWRIRRCTYCRAPSNEVLCSQKGWSDQSTAAWERARWRYSTHFFNPLLAPARQRLGLAGALHFGHRPGYGAGHKTSDAWCSQKPINAQNWGGHVAVAAKEVSGLNTKKHDESIVPTVCSSHCGGACLLRVHVKDGVITRIESDDDGKPPLRACLRGRAYRQRVYAPDRLLQPMRRVGTRGEGKFKHVSWDEALTITAQELRRVSDSYGPASIVLAQVAGDVCSLNAFQPLHRLLCMAGGYTATWGLMSFHAGVTASLASYGTYYASNTRDDLVNSKLIIMWGWDPANTISGTNTCWYLAQARERGARIVSVDPRYTDSAATLADVWIPIYPGTDAALLVAMAFVTIKEGLCNNDFLNAYTIGFNRYMDYVLGTEDGVPKDPCWAEKITGVAATTIEELATAYATLKPAALMAGIAPGRTAYGEQYHRAAISLAAMTGNIGIHGGDAAARAWESAFGGYPYPCTLNDMSTLVEAIPNLVEQSFATASNRRLFLSGEPMVHRSKLADAILKGRAGGYFADYKLLYVAGCNCLNQFPDVNKMAKALQSLEFVVVQEQFMTPTARFADILLPVNTFMERNDITVGVGSAFIGSMSKVIESLGESRSPLQIAIELSKRMGVTHYMDRSEDELLAERARRNGIPDYATFKSKGIHRLELPEPYVAFKEQIGDPVNNPFPTPSGKIEIYSQRWADMNCAGLPPIPKYRQTWESRNDPLAKKYPLQLITTHFKRRALSQFDNIPWLKELQRQAILISLEDAQTRGISDGEMVRVFNDRGQIIVPATVTERIMPGVVDVPHGAWYNPDDTGADTGGCANVLTRDEYSPGGASAYNTCLVEVQLVAEQ